MSSPTAVANAPLGPVLSALVAKLFPLSTGTMDNMSTRPRKTLRKPPCKSFKGRLAQEQAVPSRAGLLDGEGNQLLYFKGVEHIEISEVQGRDYIQGISIIALDFFVLGRRKSIYLVTHYFTQQKGLFEWDLFDAGLTNIWEKQSLDFLYFYFRGFEVCLYLIGWTAWEMGGTFAYYVYAKCAIGIQQTRNLE